MRVFPPLIFSIYFLYHIPKGFHGGSSINFRNKIFQDDRFACLVILRALALKVLQAFKFDFVGYYLKRLKLSLPF